MKKSIMRKWVAALRSGEYVQGKGQLVNSRNKFCCLGILCNLSVDAGIGEWKRLRGCPWEFVTADDRSMGILPEGVRDWSGMKTKEGDLFLESEGETCLTILNDEDRTFAEIADIIEANWEVL